MTVVRAIKIFFYQSRIVYQLFQVTTSFSDVRRSLSTVPKKSLSQVSLTPAEVAPPLPTPDMRLPALKDFLSEEVLSEMAELLKQGFTLVDIAAYMGLEVESLYSAYQNNQGGLRERLDRAAMECKLTHLKRVNTGAINYQSSTWFLERKYRDEWGKDRTPSTPSEGQDSKQTWLVNGKELSF